MVSIDEAGDDAERWEKRRRGYDPEEDPEPAFGLRLARVNQHGIVLPVAENGALLHNLYRFRRGSLLVDPPNGAVRFLDFDPTSLHAAWNALLAAGREAEIVKAMHVLMPEIDSIHFLAADTRRSGGFLVGQRNGDRRLPIGSYGDGMRRLLALSVGLVDTENGCLLIDEIDTGLHWTVMEDMWRLVLEAAERSSVQVLATTHSLDCIKGLGSLVKSRPDLAQHVAIQKIHRSLEQAVSIPGEDIGVAVDQDIEVR